MMKLKEVAKKVYSQNGEDGAIEYIFDKIGYKHRTFVEFGFGAHENNSRNLYENYQFEGLFIDGNKHECDTARGYYRDNVKIINEFITIHNINNLISQHYNGEIDFLSIDVDGVDLYLLDIIDVIEPRVICIEYCASIGKERSVTVIYKNDFDRHEEHISGFYCGGSLTANVNVMNKKGYKLVGTINGLNAFFVKNEEKIDSSTVDECFESHYARTFESYKRHDGTIRSIPQEEQISILENLKWNEVDKKGIIKYD